MAVAFQSVATTNFTSASSINIAKPSGLAEGDLMIAVVGGLENDGDNYGAPMGWTKIDDVNNGVESVIAWYKVANASDVSASHFTFTSPGEWIGGSVTRVTGGVVASMQSSKQFQNLGGTFNTADLTPTFANSLLLFYVMGLAAGDNVAGYACATDNPSWSEAFDFENNTPATDLLFGMGYAVRSAVTASGDFSISAGGESNFAIIICIPPQTDADGTHSLLEMGPSTVQDTGISVSTTASHELLEMPVSTVFEPSGEVVEPRWTDEEKGMAPWTNETKT